MLTEIIFKKLLKQLLIIAAETINALFQKGQLFLEGFPIWSQDGTDNLCDHPAERKYCPWRVGGEHPFCVNQC